jgi:hypothetical protein
MEKYYVYAHYKPGETEPFLVGKGFGYRAKSKYGRNKWWKHIVNKYGYEVRIICEQVSEDVALWLETELIKAWGRADQHAGPLVNMTNGGEGSSGRKSVLKGVPKPEEQRRKISETLTGVPQTKERRHNQSKRMREEVSSEFRKKMSDAAKKRWSIHHNLSKTNVV